jgi:O-antigen ligase
MRQIQVREILGFLTSLFLVAYFLIPIKIYPLPCSFHIIPMLCAFLVMILAGSVFIRVPASFYALLVALVISLLWNPTPSKTNLIVMWSFSLISFLVVANTFNYLRRDLMLKAIILVGSVWILFSIGQAFLGSKLYFAGWFGEPQVSVFSSGMTIYSNYGAMMFLPFIISSLVGVVFFGGTGWYFFWALSSFSFYFMMSRAGWLGLFISSLVLFIRIKSNHSKKKSFFRALLLLFIVVSFAVILPSSVDKYEEAKLDKAFSLIHSPSGNAGGIEVGNLKKSDWFDYSINTRFVTTAVSLRVINEFPLFGIGMGNFPYYYSKNYKDLSDGLEIDERSKMTPHNGYLQFLTEMGILPFLFLVYFVFSLLRKSFLATRIDMIIISYSIISMLVWLLFHDGFADRSLWIMLGMLEALIKKNS